MRRKREDEAQLTFDSAEIGGGGDLLDDIDQIIQRQKSKADSKTENSASVTDNGAAADDAAHTNHTEAADAQEQPDPCESEAAMAVAADAVPECEQGRDGFDGAPPEQNPEAGDSAGSEKDAPGDEETDDGRQAGDEEPEIEINRDELLRKQRVAMFTKPKILLETPYTVTVGNKQYTRYRLEFDKPDKTIPPEISASTEILIPPIDRKNEEAAREERKKLKIKSIGREAAGWAAAVAVALVLALLIRSFVFVFVKVDGPSMLDTLHTDNLLFVWRAGYLFSAPERGDVIICHFPENKYYSDTGRNYVKRIVGLPGETVSISEGCVFINGRLLEEPYLSAERQGSGSMEPVTLGEDEYFVLGDNRVNSTDSRLVGPVKREDIVGKALQTVYPFDEFAPID